MALSRRAFLAASAGAVCAPVRLGAETTSLTTGSIGHSIAHFPLYVGDQLGYFAKNGVDIGKVTEFSTGALVATALTSGNLEIASSVITDVFSLAKAKRSVKIIAASVTQYYVDVVASRAFVQAAKLGEKATVGEKIQALRGKSIGVTGPGSGTDALITYLLRLGNIDRTRDAQIVNLGASIPAVLAALRSGRVDAVSFAWPLGQQAEAEGIGEIFISPARGDVLEMRNELQGVIFTTQEAIDRKRPSIVEFVRGYSAACQEIVKEPARAQALLRGFYPALDPRALERTLEIYRATSVPHTPMPSGVGFLRAVNFHKAAGLISEEYGFEQLVATGVIEDAIRHR